MIQRIIREVCGPCKKYINIGQPILECEICFTGIHTKCYKSGGFSTLNGLWCCRNCEANQPIRYNPFPLNSTRYHSDKFYDDEGAYDDVSIEAISTVLNNCHSYTIKNLNVAVKLLGKNDKETEQRCKSEPKTTKFSSYFFNIDGNKRNFNSFCVELKRLDFQLSVIALAETNVDQELQDLYQIPNYNNFYQSTIEGKEKGTGVALYVNKIFNACIVDNVSFCNHDIESIFVEISQSSSPKTLTIGVIYRPPNGNTTKFLEHFENICSNLPETGVRILGDYNIDFFKMKSNTNIPSQFEDNFLKNGLAPVISIATHSRANCNPSCIDFNENTKFFFNEKIDNIVTNYIERTLRVGWGYVGLG